MNDTSTILPKSAARAGEPRRAGVLARLTHLEPGAAPRLPARPGITATSTPPPKPAARAGEPRRAGVLDRLTHVEPVALVWLALAVGRRVLGGAPGGSGLAALAA